MSPIKDLAGVVRSIRLILDASLKLNSEHLCYISKLNERHLNQIIQEGKVLSSKIKGSGSNENIISSVQDGVGRMSAVIEEQPVHSSHKLSNPSSKRLIQSVEFQTVSDNAQLVSIILTPDDKKVLQKLDMEHRSKKELEKKQNNATSENVTEETTQTSKSKQKLNENAKQRKVPSSRVGRMVSFGSLAAGLGVGAATEYAKRAIGISDSSDGENLFLNKGNLERIVDTLCKVRGAALKLGQMLSIQDESVVHPELSKALERVRKSADFMPDWQVDRVMFSELGDSWEETFLEFERKPFAAASIGQVHYGKLKDGREVAIKIQYPGVAKGIESDIDNLGGLMKMWNAVPKGMFFENIMAVTKRELAWEVDYLREADCARKFKNILNGYEQFYVPTVVDELSTKQIFTTEYLDGVPVDQCFNMDQEHRQFIGEKVMELCLLEILRFNFMQTDPNWANFLYNPSKKRLLLLDFGASREYSKPFLDKYVLILKAACDDNRDVVLKESRALGFLTGYESKIMENAHVDAVMILGEIFRAPEKYDFAHQDMTARIQDLAQVMLVHRLCPPPEEIYSLHRKLSGVFLLLSKLKVAINCRNTFLTLYNEYAERNKL